MYDQLAHLIELQEKDLKLKVLREKESEIPELIDTMVKKEESIREECVQKEKDVKQSEIDRKQMEIDLGGMEEKITKYQQQLFSIKTNKEYQSMQNEIGTLEREISDKESDILKSMEKSDKMREDLVRIRGECETECKEIDAKMTVLKEELEDLKKDVKSKEEGRKKIADNVAAAILTDYEKVLKNKDYIAVIHVANECCQGCFFNLPPQFFNEVKRNNRIIHCENCNRILYWKENEAK